MYKLSGIARAIVPRYFTQSALEKTLQSLFRIYDKKLEYISHRVNFYNKLSRHFIMPESKDDLPKNSSFGEYDFKKYLGGEGYGEYIYSLEHKYSQFSRLNNMQCLCPNLSKLSQNSPKYGSAYYFDSYEWSRYFRDDITWCFLFKDVWHLITYPSIVKSRPIMQENINSILLQLDKFRHFSFVKDNIKFEDKKNILFFRGAVHQEHRIRFFKTHFNNPKCDLGHVGNINDYNKAWHKQVSPIKEHLKYKFLLSLEGFDVASNLKWIMGSNSLCVMPKPEMETWFMESTLKPNIHYAEISEDYSDLDSVLDFYLSNERIAKEIVHNANEYARQFFDKRLEGFINLLVLRKYFYLSSQIKISNIEKQIFNV